MDIISEYNDSTNLDRSGAFKFLRDNRRIIIKELGVGVFKEMTINYRTYFLRNRKNKIINDYKKYIMTKDVTHTSDLAIGYNIVKTVGVDSVTESIIVDFMFNRIHTILANQNPNTDIFAKVYILKKNIVLSYIDTIMTKKPT